MHGEFYKDRYAKYLQQDTLQKNKNISDIKAWKQQIVAKINRLRAEHFKKALRRYAAVVGGQIAFQVNKDRKFFFLTFAQTSIHLPLEKLTNADAFFEVKKANHALSSMSLPYHQESEMLDILQNMWKVFPFRLKTNAGKDYVTEQNSTIALESNRANACLLYTSPSPRDRQKSRMPSSA